MPRSGTTDWMHGRNVGGITADQRGGEAAELLELGKAITPRRGFQSPMQMELVLGLRAAVNPDSAAGDHQGGRPEKRFQPSPCCAWIAIALDRQRQALEQIALASV